MSTELAAEDSKTEALRGVPELSALGRRLELLRIDRGISKQRLARFAGTSRQQLWRVMTGKSELSGSLRDRLAQVLGVDAAELTVVRAVPPVGVLLAPEPAISVETNAATTISIAEYVGHPQLLIRTLASMPTGALGVRLKRQLLNAVEDLALERSISLGSAFFDVRRRVLAGEL